MKTKRGYVLGDVVSALQKAIRRGDARLGGYFAMEMFESGYSAYAWRRLLTISAEDCHGCITQEVKALYDASELVRKNRRTPERIFIAKAAVLLAEAEKCRDADHMSCLMYDKRREPDESRVARALAQAERDRPDIPDYAFDCHTQRGRKAGKTRDDFFVDEHDALTPRVPGLFDDDVERHRREMRKRR